MEIVLTWSWFAFWMGVLATVGVAFWGLVFLAVVQYNKQKKAAKRGADSIEKLFQGWGGKGSN